jgi:hypothetical protein
MVNTAELISANINKDDKRWISVLVSYYEALRMYAEAFLQFDRVKISNHECLFTYLCRNHKEFELDWEFFERVRTKRNGIHYYGESIDYKVWKEFSTGLDLYVSLLKKEVERKISERTFQNKI